MSMVVSQKTRNLKILNLMKFNIIKLFSELFLFSKKKKKDFMEE